MASRALALVVGMSLASCGGIHRPVCGREGLRNIGRVAYSPEFMVEAGATRLAELLGGLSLACDLADGFAPETILRITTLAAAIGKRHGLSTGDLHDVYYVTLLKYLGCTAFAHEETHEYGAGNDIDVRRTMSLADPAQLVFSLRRIGRGVGGSGPLRRGALAVAKIFGDGVAFSRRARAQRESSIRLAQIVRLGDRVQRALAHACERWDGKGEPKRLSEAGIDLAMRVSLVAEVLVLAAMEVGVDSVLGEAKEGRLDAAVVRALLDTETGDAPRRAAWPKGLSDREGEVLRYVARGKTNKEIAQALGVSPKTVQHHVAHAYEKIGVESRAAAALFVSEMGLLLPSTPQGAA